MYVRAGRLLSRASLIIQMWLFFAVLLILALTLGISNHANAAMRLQDRGIYINTAEAGAETFHRVSFRYMSPDPIGSVEMLFCNDPIPYHDCVVPEGMNVSNAVLSEQLGEIGFEITQQSVNRIVISRSAKAPTDHSSSYTLDGIINPQFAGDAFAIRLKTFTSTDASGPQVDFGSMRAQITQSIEIRTQVPPMLIFCLAEEVEQHCSSTNKVHYRDMGQLSPNETLTARSEMAVGTNASAGFTINVYGSQVSAGTSVIESSKVPTRSTPGLNQFGINLVENSDPQLGDDPEGEWANAVTTADYGLKDRYLFNSGDMVAYSPNVSLMKKFTVSYILNSSPDLRAGVYTTTLNFVAAGRF